MEPSGVGLIGLVVLTVGSGFLGAIMDRRPGVVFNPVVAATVAGALLGAVFGARLLLPPEPGPGDLPNCGLMVLPAIFVGCPVGFVFGAVVGWLSGRVLASMTGIPPARRENRGKKQVDWSGSDFE